MIKLFKSVRYKSKNPFNRQGLNLINLMKNNAYSNKLNNQSIYNQDWSIQNKILDNEKSSIDSLNFIEKNNCISLN